MPKGREFAHANYDVCQEAATVISDFVAYGKSKGSSVSLREKLNLPHSRQTMKSFIVCIDFAP